MPAQGMGRALADQVVAGIGDLLDLIDQFLLGSDLIEIGPVADLGAVYARDGSLQIGRDTVSKIRIDTPEIGASTRS